MDSRDSKDVNLRESLILASAFLHAPPRGRIHANCARVLQHALTAAGLWDQKLAEAASAVFTGDEEALEEFPIVAEWYTTLIELTQQQPEHDRLLNGAGNLVTPAGAFFTACWPTPAGEAVAGTLLAENPTWREKLGRPRKTRKT